jgi:capsular polysaccharide transport system ATP-binding protein
MIIVSHHTEVIREHCRSAAVLENGQLTSFNDLTEAFEVYESEMAG